MESNRYGAIDFQWPEIQDPERLLLRVHENAPPQ